MCYQEILTLTKYEKLDGATGYKPANAKSKNQCNAERNTTNSQILRLVLTTNFFLLLIINY